CAGNALADAARGMGPLARANPHRCNAPHDTVLPVMGAKLSPSPEIVGAGSGVLEVDYADGQTRTFDIGWDGSIKARRYAYAFAMVVETDHELSEDERDAMIDGVDFQSLLGADPTFCSTPERIALNTGDYDVQPRDVRTPTFRDKPRPRGIDPF